MGRKLHSSRGGWSRMKLGLSSCFVLICVYPILLHGQIISGIDVLKKNEFAILQGRKIGLITNQTGVSRDGRRSIDVLFEAANLRLIAIFSPEHGIRGVEDRDTISDSVDEPTGLPIYSLYGKTHRPTSRMLKGINTLVYDIQDVGTRHFTYITTLAYCMDEAARHRMKFIVLDRPVMINGTIVEGDVPSDTVRKFVRYFQIPTRYGMTPGELARYYNEEGKVGCDLEVVKMQGWNRTRWYDQTGLRWKNPSPNLRRLDQVLLYSGLGCFEWSNLSVGRGTEYPFEYYGAPYLDPEKLAGALEKAGVVGVKFSPVRFTPTSGQFREHECRGVKIEITDREALRVSRVFATMAVELKRQAPQWNYHSDRFADLVGSRSIIDALDHDLTTEEILRIFDEKVQRFQKVRAKYLLY
jgi:uncharacterized protein YbbC (DUF1343 family)